MTEAIYLAGPTASGKSAVALELAQRIGGEIISVDSMQVYRGLDIGTAKPSTEECQRVPHHLIDVVNLSESFDAAQFVRLAQSAEAGIRAKGLRPVFCGGTGLYFNALIGGLTANVPPDRGTRAELENTPLPRLLEELYARDPGTFAKIDRNNSRRVIRALELLRSGEMDRRSNWNKRKQAGRWFGMERDRSDLHARIDQRVEEMFRRGLLDETKALIERGLRTNRTAMQAIGYRQVIEHLDGLRDLPSTIALVKQKTRQYAKRQLTWFRHQLDLHWLHVPPEESAAAIARKIAAAENSA
jgi:tRNA dimethylallyltransferase